MKRFPDKPTGETPDRSERIEAYLAGELSESEAASIERAAGADPDLARELADWRGALDAARDWMQDDPPGLARVEAVPLTSLMPPPGRVSVIDALPPNRAWRRRSWRLAWAAALLMAGFALGRMSMSPSDQSDHPIADFGWRIADSDPPLSTQHPAPGTLVSNPQSAIRNPQSVRPAIATRTTDEHGRLVVETTLQGSGGQALWVIDGSFAVASANGY